MKLSKSGVGPVASRPGPAPASVYLKELVEKKRALCSSARLEPRRVVGTAKLQFQFASVTIASESGTTALPALPSCPQPQLATVHGCGHKNPWGVAVVRVPGHRAMPGVSCGFARNALPLHILYCRIPLDGRNGPRTTWPTGSAK